MSVMGRKKSSTSLQLCVFMPNLFIYNNVKLNLNLMLNVLFLTNYIMLNNYMNQGSSNTSHILQALG